jgi:hypothetical protein
MGAAEDYRSRIESLLASLSLPAELISERGLTLQPEAGSLRLPASAPMDASIA